MNSGLCDYSNLKCEDNFNEDSFMVPLMKIGSIGDVDSETLSDKSMSLSDFQDVKDILKDKIDINEMSDGEIKNVPELVSQVSDDYVLLDLDQKNYIPDIEKHEDEVTEEILGLPLKNEEPEKEDLLIKEEVVVNDEETMENVEKDENDKRNVLVEKRGRGRPKVLYKKTHPCSVCHKIFSRKTHLTTHLRIHSDEKPYSCNLCFKRFRDNSVLIKHVRVHTQDKPYSCQVCGKAFNQKGNMERHARQHTNEKPYMCSVCSNTFANKSHLQRHYRIHINEKPYICELCEKAFRQKSHLMRHVLVHSREKPYACNMCDKRFRQEQHVTRHKKTHIKHIITEVLLKQCISNPIPACFLNM